MTENAFATLTFNHRFLSSNEVHNMQTVLWTTSLAYEKGHIQTPSGTKIICALKVKFCSTNLQLHRVWSIEVASHIRLCEMCSYRNANDLCLLFESSPCTQVAPVDRFLCTMGHSMWLCVKDMFFVVKALPLNFRNFFPFAPKNLFHSDFSSKNKNLL